MTMDGHLDMYIMDQELYVVAKYMAFESFEVRGIDKESQLADVYQIVQLLLDNINKENSQQIGGLGRNCFIMLLILLIFHMIGN